MKKFLFFTLAAGLLTAASTSTATVRQGLSELNFSAAYANLDADGADLEVITLSGSYGYFFTDAIQGAVHGSYFDVDVDGDSLNVKVLGAGGNYHFNVHETLVPYVGGAAYWAEADVAGQSEDDWAWQARAGLKQFVQPNVAVTYQVSYIDFDDTDLSGVFLGAGLSFFF